MKELIEKLKKRSKVFKENARHNYENFEYDIAMFNLEQAAQLMLKAKILEFGVQFPKIHDIFELIKILKDLGVNFENIEKYYQTIEKLNAAYISSRYFPFSFSKVDVEEAFRFIEELEKILWKQ